MAILPQPTRDEFGTESGVFQNSSAIKQQREGRRLLADEVKIAA
jgi:hypothetical protein